MTDEIGYKKKKLPFWLKFKALGEGCLKNWKSADKYKKKTVNILCFVITLIISLNIFLVFACQCSMLISLSNVSNLAKNGHFPIFSLFWWPFLLAHLSRRLKVSYSDWSSCVARPFVGNLYLKTISLPEPLVQI